MLRYFDQNYFCKVHNIGPINVCANFEINRYKIDEFRKHAKIVCLFDVKVLGIFISNILQPTRSLYDFRFKIYGSNSALVLMFLMTLTFGLCSIDCYTR